MQVRRVGRRAVLLDGLDDVAAWQRAVAGALAALAPDDVVPGASTLLLDGVDPAEAERLLRDLRPAPATAADTAALVEVPVVYDGDDLAEVARLWGTSPRGVVERHTATAFRVAFCGFAPGFPYLAGLDARVPRRRTPRTRVPAGSVGLADRWCGIYPGASPGGWQLLGRAGVRLFDPDRDPPALLPPGTRVRFVEVDALAPEPDRPVVPVLPRRRSLVVVRAGAQTTVQDGGRPGSAHLGVPRAGALDVGAARLAHRLVGDREDAALLETTLDGVALRARVAVSVAVTGAEAPVTVDGRPQGWGVAVGVRAGQVLDVGPASRGVRSYVAVAGGLQVPAVLGSRSTDTLSGLGPPRLAAGQVLPVGEPSEPPPVEFSVPRGTGEVVLRLAPGPRDDGFPDGLSGLCATTWTLSSASDRVGARLAGPALARRDDGELDSEGMVLGAVQVPPDGRPVVLLADHGTTGGYPVIGVVDPHDLDALAQARPGTSVRFRRCP